MILREHRRAATAALLCALAVMATMTAVAASSFAQLEPATPQISISGAATAEEGKPYLLDVEITGADAREIVRWTVSWGDGTTTSGTGLPGSIEHTYSHLAAVHQITVSLTTSTGTTYSNANLVVAEYDNAGAPAIYDLSGTKTPEQIKSEESGSFTSVLVGPDGLLYALDDDANKIVRFSVAKQSQVDEFVGSNSKVQQPVAMAFSTDGQLLVIDAETATIHFVSLDDGQTTRTIDSEPHLNRPSALLIGPDGDIFVADASDDDIERFDADTGKYLGTFATFEPGASPTSIVWGPEDSLLVALPGSGEIATVLGASKVDKFGADVDTPQHLAVGPDGALWVTDYWSDTVTRFNLTTGESLDKEPVIGKVAGPSGLTFVPDVTLTVVAPEEPSGEDLLTAADWRETLARDLPVDTLTFVANEGVAEPGLDFIAQTDEYIAVIAGSSVEMAHDRAAAGQVLTMVLNGATDKAPSAASTGTRVAFDDVYDGIDAVYSDDDGELEYSFIIDPGADVDDISLDFEGASSVRVTDVGDLFIDAEAGPDFRSTAPFVYQSIDGNQVTIPSAYVVNGDGTVGFSLGAFDPTRPVVIDPILTPATNLVMVTGAGDLSDPSDAERSTFLAGLGYSVTVIAAFDAQTVFDSAATTNDVMFMTASASGASGAGTKARGLDIGVLTESVSAFSDLMYSPGYTFTSSSTSTNDILDNSHYITSTFSTGTTTFFTPAQSDLAWDSATSSLAPGSQILAESSADQNTLVIIDTGAALFSANTATNRRILLPTYISPTSSWTADLETVVERAVAWGTSQEGGGAFTIVSANSDSGSTTQGVAVGIDPSANDTDAESDAIVEIDITDPDNGGVVINGDETVTYTPDPGYTGPDSFDYWAIDAGADLTNYWGLAGTGIDAFGSADGVITGATTVAGDFGNALSFDETDDRVTIPDFAYGSDFSLSFDFKLDDNTGTLFQYVYSHGDVNSVDSVNVFFLEASHGSDPNTLRTVVRDGDDTLDNAALQTNIAAFVGDGQWHTYTLTSGSTGLTVWVDGVAVASDATRGTGGVNPSGPAYFGTRQDLAADRWYGGSLDTVQIYERTLTSDEVTDLDTGTNRSTVSITVAPCTVDTDGDGLWDCEEDANTDADNNPATSPGPDTDGDTLPNYLDADDDGDTILTSAENADPNSDGDPRDARDSDHDGEPDYLDLPTGSTDGSVVDEQKISDTQGDLTAALDNGDWLGHSAASIGDVDGDGVADIATGAFSDDDGGSDRGAVYILFLNPDGTVRAEQKISSLAGGLIATLDDGDRFGDSVGGIGDLDGDGTPDIAVGARSDDDGGSGRGAVHVLFLNPDGTVRAEQKISSLAGGLTTTLDDNDNFGSAVGGIGDLDGDGTPDIAVGARSDDDGGPDRGAVHILFLNPDGTVSAEQKISSLAGGLTTTLDDTDYLGSSLDGVGDLDGDGTSDLAVGAHLDDDGGSDRGAVYILFLNPDGTVRAEQKISSLAGGLTATLDDNDRFGHAVSAVGDLDGDGDSDIVIGAPYDDDGGPDRGALYVVFLDTDGSVEAEQKISDSEGDLATILGDGDEFGNALAGIGDLDQDGTINLAIGARRDDDGGSNRGAIYVLDLAERGCLAVDSDTDGLWNCEEDANTDADDDPATNPGPDTDGDTNPNYLDADDDGDTILTSAENADPNGDGDPRDALDSDHDGRPDYLDALTGPTAGSVADEDKISDAFGGFATALTDTDLFGSAVASIGDIDSDGVEDLVVGAPYDDDGGSNRGAIYVLFMNPDGTVRAEQKISDTQGSLTATMTNADLFGASVAGIGDIDGDGINDIAIGAPQTDVNDSGGVHILFLNSDGTVKAEQLISNTVGNLAAALTNTDYFGSAVAGLGDLDGDGINDIAVGAPGDDDGGTGRGAAYILFLSADGTVKGYQKISDTDGNLTAALDDNDTFGAALANIGDIDGDSIADLAVGTPKDDDSQPATGANQGAVHVLLLDTDGTVQSSSKISDTVGDLTTLLDSGDEFGASLAGVGDLDLDGVPDLVVGAPYDDDGAGDRGAAYVLFMTASGTVKAEQKISDTDGNLTAALDNADWFGFSVAGLGDPDGDGTIGVVVGAPNDDDDDTVDGGNNRGAIYTLDLAPNSILTVNSTGDASDTTPGDNSCNTGSLNSEGNPECTLRAAIEEANASAVINSIHFDVPTSDSGYAAAPLAFTITPGSVLPAITSSVVLDATTQSEYAGRPVIQLDGKDATGATAGILIHADDVTVSGFIVHSFDDEGIEISSFGSSADRSTIINNWVGIDASEATKANLGDGILVTSGSADNTIGSPGQGNVISGNDGAGVLIRGANSDNNIVAGNLIGVGSNGSTPIPNGRHGIEINDTTTGNRIGGTLAADANTIANNGGDGVAVLATAGSDNAVLRNEIHSNAGMGIDIDPNGVNANDPGDTDGPGPNDFLNYPSITSATTSGIIAILTGTYDVPAGSYRFDFYKNPSGADASGFGEGEQWVATSTLSHSGSGAEGWGAAFVGAVGDIITITVTEDLGGGNYGSTSEFSSAATVTAPAIVVNSTGDAPDQTPGDGACDTGGTNSQGATECTLRAAIEESNALAGGDSIEFNMPNTEPGHTSGVWTISPPTVYPELTERVVMDASSQPGFVSTPIIELDGSAMASSSDRGLQLGIGSDGSTVRGLSVISFPGAGLYLEGSDNHTIVGNYIGLAADGSTAAGNRYGMYMTASSSTTIGGTTPADRNVISANTFSGVAVYNSIGLGLDSLDTVIIGNYIGTDSTGLLARGNARDGLFVVNGSSRTQVGGSNLGEGNLIAANTDAGVYVGSGSMVDTVVVGNTIGVSVDGAIELPNEIGVEVGWSQQTIVRDNIIGSATSHGVLLSSADNAIVAGNTIGTDLAGSAAWTIGGHGVLLENTSELNTIGGTLSADANTITNAALSGVAVPATAGSNNTILRNNIFSNAGLGIDLDLDGVTPNSTIDSWLDYPNITSITPSGGTLTVEFNLDIPAGSYRIEFFNNLSGADPSGFGEGEAFVHATTATHTGSGTELFSVNFAGAFGDVITATATEDLGGGSFGSTSEFSGAVAILPVAMVNSTGDLGDATPGDDICDTGGTNSAGATECTLRAAIDEANASVDINTIEFDMPTTEAGHSAGVWTIAPSSQLSDIAQTTTIDATTQTGWTSTPTVELNGTGAGAGSDGLRVASDDSVIRGLAVNRFQGDGLKVLSGAANTIIESNHIGLDSTGLIDRGNIGRGVDLQSGSGPTTVGGTLPTQRNVISGNGDDGIIIFGSDSNVVIGNFIGTDVTGVASGVGIGNASDGVVLASGSAGNTIGQPGSGNVLSGNANDGLEIDDTTGPNTIQANVIGLGLDGDTPVPNGRYGIVLYNGANNTQIGGGGADEGNVISANTDDGVYVDGNSNAATTANVIEGNLIGTDATGTLDRGNVRYGVRVDNAATSTIIGGPGAGNTISGNGEDGIYLSGVGTDNTVIQGNYVGTTAAGDASIPNVDRGIQIESGASFTQIGGIAPGEENVISGNGGDGVIIADWLSLGTTGTVVEGNLIGVEADGSTPLGNGGHGVQVDPVTGNRIGGTAAGSGNVIANNGSTGTQMGPTSGINTVLGNSIYANAGIGLGLDRDGVTPNDPGDADSGPNGLLNFPDLTSASVSAGSVTVDFELDVPSGDYRIELFTNPSGADPTGFGEGEVFGAAVTVTHTGSGAEAFSTTFSGGEGDVLTATATQDLGATYGATSEFSAAVLVACPDADADGLCNLAEDANTDADNDPATNPGPNTDGDANPNYLDADDDGDGIPTSAENADPNADGDPRDARDTDVDGQPDYLDLPTVAASPIVATELKIGNGTGGLVSTLDNNDTFGYDTVAIGDLDGDGIVDLAVGALWDGDGGTDRGAVYILFLNADGSVKSEQKISDLAGGLTTTLDDDDNFGSSISAIGDLDGDGIVDIAVGARRDDDGGTDRGAIYVLLLNADGTVKAEQKISDLVGGLSPALADAGWFGDASAGIGDLNGDGIPDLGVGAPHSDDLFILFMNADGTVQSERLITTGNGGLSANVAGDDFGEAIGNLGDLDGDGINDLAVGAYADGDGGGSRGAVYILFMNANGTVKAEQKISSTQGGLAPVLENSDFFGTSVASLGDAFGDGSTVLAVGASGDDDGGQWHGAVYLLALDPSGSVLSTNKISDLAGEFTSPLGDYFEFGSSVTSVGDLDGDGTIGLAVGAYGDNDGVGFYQGAVYVLDLALDTSITVNSTGDLGDAAPGDDICDTGGINGDGSPECTLRAAIQEVNASARLDTVNFALTATDPNHSAGTWTISPTSALPFITTPMTIDGTTQPGFVANTNAAPQGINWTQVIAIEGGSAPSGTRAFWVQADDVTISGLTIGNFYWSGGYAIEIDADRTIVTATSIGTDLTGLVRSPLAYGIWANGSDIVIGGSTPADRNLITGADNGQVNFTPGPNALVDGNLIGTNVDADGVLSAWGTGVEVWGGTGVQIGTAAAGNVIGTYWGIEAGDGTVIENNLIGTNSTFTADLGDWQAIGAYGDNVTIVDNVIGNWDEGIGLSGDNATVAGNWIGADPSGTVDLGNLDLGIELWNGATNATIGGTLPGDANVITNNGGDGISVLTTAVIPAILSNEIFNNGDLGIDILRDGVTVNSVADAILDYPTIIDVAASAGTVTVDIDLDLPAGDYRIEFFENPSGGDPSGYGEGQTFAHGETLTHTGSGIESFTITYPGTSTVGLVATTTVDLGGGAYGSTSEFSEVVLPVHTVNSTRDASDLTPGNGTCDTGALNSAGIAECSLRAAIEEANALGNASIAFDMPTTETGHTGGIWTLSPASAFDDISVTLIVDGSTQPGWTSTPVVQIDGSAAGSAVDGLRLLAGSDGTEIRSLSIGNFDSDAIEIQSDDVLIVGNHLGLDAAGTTATPMVTGAGVNLSGAARTTIGGSTTNDRNVIGGGPHGIVVGNASTDTVVIGNYIGTDVTGSVALGAISQYSIYVLGGSADTKIGGPLPSDRNIIGSRGIYIRDETTGTVLIENNSIGVGADGTSALTVASRAILVTLGPDDIDIIDNVIGNAYNAIEINGSTTNGDVQGNIIGTDAGLTTDHGTTTEAIVVHGGAADIQVGGLTPAESNRIQFVGDGFAAIFVTDAATDDVHVLGNTIMHDHGAIDLGDDGPTANDAGDVDGGANDLLNFPTLAVTNTSGGGPFTVDLDVSLDTAAGDHRIEIYSNADPGFGGLGKAEVLQHAFTFTHTGSGVETISTSYVGSSYTALSATATEEFGGGTYGSTSEMSPIAVVAANATVNSTGDTGDADLNDGQCNTGGTNSEGAAECTFRAAIEQTNRATSSTVDFAIPTTDPGYDADGYWTITQASDYEHIYASTTIDGSTQTGYDGSRPVVFINDNSVGTDHLTLAAHDVTLRSLALGKPGDDSIQVEGQRATIDDLWIGIDPAGNLVGSPSNGNEGIILYNGAADLVVQDSRIADFDSGIVSNSGTVDAIITGTEIFGNRNGGIVFDDSGQITAIGNSIHDNLGLGIELGNNDGLPLPNDVGDADGGANALLNYPVLTGATVGAGTLDINYDLDVPAGTYRVEFFDNTAPDPSGNGEGEAFVASATIAHGGGSATYLTSIPGVAGDVITATATPDLGGGIYEGTSEFSNVLPIGVVFVNSTGDAPDTSAGDGTCDTGALNSDGLPECTLRAAMGEAVSNTAIDIIHFQIPETDPGFTGGASGYWTIAPTSTLPFSTDITEIDASSQPGWSGSPVIELDGNSVVSASADGLHAAAGMTIRGLSITRWLDDGAASDQDDVVFSANWFGVAPDGTPRPNGESDLVLYFGADSPLIGGPTPDDGNVFAAGGSEDGVVLVDNVTNATVQNNRFGVAADGITSLNTATAELLVITGDTSATLVTENQFGGSPNAAIVVTSNATGVSILSNDLGTDDTGSAILPIGSALYLDTAGSVQFGGTSPAEWNTVRNVLNQGVLANASHTGSYSYLGNSLVGSGVVGIDLGFDGITPNDPGDADNGANELLNFPEISSAVESGGTVRVAFGLDVPAGTYRVEAFTNPSGAHPTGYGEGEVYETSMTVAHAGAGRQSYELTFPGSIGALVSMTATQDLGGGLFGATSEFSQTVQATDPALVLDDDRSQRRSDLASAGGVDITNDGAPGQAGQAVQFDGSNDRLVGPAVDITDAALTMYASFNADGLAGDPVLLSKRTGGGSAIYELSIDSGTGEIVAEARTSGGPATARGGSITAGVWHQALATWDGVELVLFLDGVELDRVSLAGSLTTDVTTDLIIGSTSTNSAPFQGLIDDVRVSHETTDSATAQTLTENQTTAGFVSVGGEQTSAPSPWTTSNIQTRSGTFALAAPETSGSGAAAWAVATGIDEPGLVFESWWWFSSDTGIDLSSGTRAGDAPTDQYEAALTSPSGWELRQRSGGTGSFDAAAAGSPTAGAWVHVEIRTDQFGATRLFIGGSEVTTATPQGSALLSGSMALRAGLLPTGQSWYIDDARGRKLVTPEPLASVGPLDRN